MRRGARWIGAVSIALLLAVCGLRAAQESPPGGSASNAELAGRYSDLVYRFRYGQSPEAALALAQWQKPEVERALKFVRAVLVSHQHLAAVAVEGSADAKRHAREDELRYGLDAAELRYLKAAVGLHVTVAALAWREGHDVGALDHTGYVRAAYDRLLWEHDPAFAARWCRVSGALLMGTVYYGDALQLYQWCLERKPRDPWLLLGRGSTLEVAEGVIAGLEPGQRLGNWPGPTDVARLRKDATADYEQALTVDPGLDEARIRLARLQLDAGDRAAAVRGLSAVLSHQLEPVLGYWAHLFLGDAEERGDHPDVAAAQYRSALALYPRAQSAAIALAHVLAERLGERSRARTVLQGHIAPFPVRRFDSDPWWLYPGGEAWRVPGWVTAFEQRSRQ